MKCPTCGTENETNAAFCDQCGASLSTTPPSPHRGSPSTPPPPPERVGMPVAPCHLIIGCQPISVPLKKETILGRADSASGWNPDVDLAPYGGTPSAWVSRSHVKIVWQDGWVLEDLDSTNGTFLRGQRLVPGTRAPVHNGEEFQIGKLQVTFFAR